MVARALEISECKRLEVLTNRDSAGKHAFSKDTALRLQDEQQREGKPDVQG